MKSMPLQDFSNWLNELYQPNLFKDYCPNGLVVEATSAANATVSKVVTGVSLRRSLIERAIEVGANAIVVHHPHGFWNNQSRLPVGPVARQLQLLFAHGISVWGFHLPMDGQREIGNNVCIAKAMGWEVAGGFMREGQAHVGVLARIPQGMSYPRVKDAMDKAFGIEALHALPHGPVAIDLVGICSGAGASALEELRTLGAHMLLTGEIKEQTPIQAEEMGINVVAYGHHRTETYGPKALTLTIQEQLGLSASFIDVPNAV